MNNSITGDRKERFKMYKAGKTWLIAGTTFLSLFTFTAMNSSIAHADTTQATGVHVTQVQKVSQTSAATSQASEAKTTQVTSASSTSQAPSASQGSSTSASSQSSQTSQSQGSQAQQSQNSAKSQTSSQATSAEAPKATPASNQQSMTSQSNGTATSNSSSKAQNVTTPTTVTPASQATKAVKQPNKIVPSNAVTPKAKINTKVYASKVQLRSFAVSDIETPDNWTIGDKSRPRVDAVDVSSYQQGLSQRDYYTLKNLGVKSVIAKATQGTNYDNPYFIQQVKRANAAGLNVDVYHYATFGDAASAIAEAQHLGLFLKSNDINHNVLIFADMEDPTTYTTNIQSNLTDFWNTLNNYGYKNHGVYTYKSYLYRDAVIRTVGDKNTWLAQAPYSPTNTTEWNTDKGAWQLSSTTYLPSGSDYQGAIDASMDYTGLLSRSAGTQTIGQSSNNITPTPAPTPNNTDYHPNNNQFSNASGTYKFTKTTAIKISANNSAKTVGTYYAGDKVIYNGKAIIGNQYWLRYTGPMNIQHYVNVTPTSNNSNTTVTPKFSNASGAYKFTQTTAIKSGANDNSATVGHYYRGETVYINGKSTVGGQTWLRYLSNGGTEHYVHVVNSNNSNDYHPVTPKFVNASGAYKFTENTAIKSSANDNAATVGHYYRGETVYINGKSTVGGQTWLRYLSSNGTQHYVHVNGNSNSSQSNNDYKPVTPSFVNASGAYKFTQATAIKSSASDNATTVGTYYRGDTVYINGKSTVGGQTWLRYLSSNGTQHYVHVNGNSNNSDSPSKKSNEVSTHGTYRFTTTTNIRTSASTSARIVGTYYRGDTVNYIATIQSDGYTWLKYISNNGFHYAAIV